MSTPLTDGINALTQYANEITGKSDTTLSDAVGSLVEGYGQGGFNPWSVCYSCSEQFREVTVPQDLTIDFDGNVSLKGMSRMFYHTDGLKNLTIKNLKSSVVASAEYWGYSPSIETITFDNCDFAPTSWECLGRACPKLKSINGIIDGTKATNMNYIFPSSPLLENFRFKENSISVKMRDFGTNNAPYTVESYISLANGLNSTTPQQIEAKNSLKTAVTNIIGTNDNGTFIADPNGTMTLADFITTVKGWTLS